MESFGEIYARAVVRHDGEDAVESRLPDPSGAGELAALSDDRCLAEMARCIFRSGFVWRVVEAKWPGFEEAFYGFDPEIVAELSEPQIERLCEDTRIIRHAKKIESVVKNAQFVLETAQEHGSVGRFLADWPGDDIVSLWLHLRKHASRLGGDTGPMFLRGVGKDTFLLTRDVVAYLVEQGVLTKKPTSQRDLRATQEIFNALAEESGRPLSHLSRIIALSVGEVYSWEH